jgi:type IV pilus assembly protein PilE
MSKSLPSPRARLRPAAGFTLIELMIAVAIVAILSAIAYPSYRNYVIRGQIVNATDGLSAVQANMERYYQDNRTYLTTTGTPVFTPPCLTSTTYGQFTVSCVTGYPTATTFQLQAVGNTGTQVSAFSYFIDQAGNQWSTVSAGAPSGWTSCATGWEVKAGQC